MSSKDPEATNNAPSPEASALGVSAPEVSPEVSPEAETASAASAAPPATPNQHNLPDVASVDYEKILESDDEEVYLEETTDAGSARDSLLVQDNGDAQSQDDDNDLDNGDNATITKSVNNDASVTSNFTNWFMPPPSPARTEATESAKEIDNAAQVPLVPNNISSLFKTPAAKSNDDQSVSSETPMILPAQYIVNDPSNHYDDDISTIANDTNTVAKSETSESNSYPQTPNRKATDAPPGPASPDMTDGASQPSLLATKRQNDQKKNQSQSNNSVTFQPPKEACSTSDESKPAGSEDVGELDNKSVFSFASSYRRFRGGSGWTRKHYAIACCMTFFLLATIAALAYTFVALQANEDEVTQQSQKSARGVTPNPTPSLPTSEPTFTRTNAPSPIGPSPRPTKAPTAAPSRNPSGAPSGMPTVAPTTLAPTIAPSGAPTDSPEYILREALADVAASDQTYRAIERQGTPQRKAFEWLLDDPNFMTYLPRRKVQRFALAVLYYSTTQPQFAQESMQTWMSYDTNECTWFTSWFENRLACGSDDIFKFLTLRNINLIGEIPAEITLLRKLNSLVLSNNGLAGTIPREFGEWDSLENLDLGGNYLIGQIPDFKNTPNIRNINLDWNALTGTVPVSVTELTSLRTLDLTENFLTGSVPTRVCQRNLDILGVDCDEIRCTCCTKCSSEETRAPVVVPPTPPTLPPTKPPTRRPTPRPTGRPTPSPTPGPTRRPTRRPTGRPTPSPTPAPCFNGIQTDKSCYSFGETILVNFRNCNPYGNDWIGIYPDSVQSGQHFEPLLWKWGCNSQNCYDPTTRGTVVIDSTAVGSSTWPIAPGEYKAWLFRQTGGGGAHSVLVGTGKFLVQSGQC